MVADCLVVTSTQQRHHLFAQHRPHTHGIHLDQFREHLTELSRQILMVLLHLTDEMLTRQEAIEPHVGRSIDIGREMTTQIVYPVHHQILRQAIKHIIYGILLQERLHKRITNLYQTLRIRFCATLKQEEHLILDLQIGKGQLRRAVLILRRWHQLVDILLQAYLQGKIAEEEEHPHHQQPEYWPMMTEIL